MIQVVCECGASGKVKDAMAGRKIRCRDCHGVLRIGGEKAKAKANVKTLSRRRLRSDDLLRKTTPLPALRPAQDEAIALPPPVAERRRHDGFEIRPAAKRRAITPTDIVPAKDWASFDGRRDLDHERHLRALAMWQMIGGATIALVGVVAMVVGVVRLGTSAGIAGAGVAAFFLGLGALVLGVVGGGTYLLGHHLYRFRDGARWVTAGMALCAVFATLGQVDFREWPLLSTIGLIVSLAANGCTLAMLLDSRTTRICTVEYRALVRRSPKHQSPVWWTSLFFLAPLGAVLAALVVGGLFALTFMR